MSRTLTLPLPSDMEARAFLTFSPFGTHAHGILFDADARTLAERDSRMYMDYCHRCILASVVRDMATPDALSDDAIDTALDDAGMSCACCDCDCDDCDDDA